MSRFYSQVVTSMQPYVPGEQPRDMRYIKLNTNESPYPPSPAVAQVLAAFSSGSLRLYPDPDATDLTEALAKANGLQGNQVLACGGSDEALGFAFMTFCNRGSKVYFPDITYGFYKVYADLFGMEAVQVPLRQDFTVDIRDYFGLDGNIFLANPNAPTGIVLSPDDIQEILRQNPDRLVLVDEAYGDFAPGSSCIPLINKYDNLLVVRTFSKSYALAGMRLGAAYGQKELIDGLNRIKYSFNPYNLDRVSLAVGASAASDRDYLEQLVAKVTATRERVAARLSGLGFTVLPSSANFLFAAHATRGGRELYEQLKHQGILVRHFPKPRIDRFVRVTIGTDDEMEQFLSKVEAMQ